jgi:hypothetical protein
MDIDLDSMYLNPDNFMDIGDLSRFQQGGRNNLVRGGTLSEWNISRHHVINCIKIPNKINVGHI